MAGRRWFAEGLLGIRSMGWCLIILATAESCRGVLGADSAATAPSAAVARGEDGGCYRPLADVIWGFLVSLLALTVSLWGHWKHQSEGALEASTTILLAVVCPLLDLQRIIGNSLLCVQMLWNCHKIEHPNSRMTSPSWLKFLCSSLFPWSKSPVRILANCDIVVYVSKGSPLLEKNWLWATCLVNDESEAMVVGENGARAFRNDLNERKQLSVAGLGLLVWKEEFSEVEEPKRLPKYDELKHLRGNSGFAVVAIAVQALGYVYAIGFRSANHLRISPLEVIGLVFNIIMLFKIFFYSTCNSCHSLYD